VQGQASEVAFLLKADTEFHVEFVLRDHTFDTTSVVALRCSKRTLLPAVGRVVSDSRLFYHRCVLSKPPRKHLPLGALVCRALDGWLTGRGGGGGGGGANDGGGDGGGGDEEDVVSEDDVDEDALDEAALAERHAGKERRRAQRKVLRKRDARHTKPASPDDDEGGGGDADAEESAGTEGGSAEEANREEEDHDSGAEEEKEAEEAAERAAMSAVTDFYALVKKWHEHGLDVSFPPTHSHTQARWLKIF
jgi:hypothetical protein